LEKQGAVAPLSNLRAFNANGHANGCAGQPGQPDFTPEAQVVLDCWKKLYTYTNGVTLSHHYFFGSGASHACLLDLFVRLLKLKNCVSVYS
jgi:hypothetical protein